MVPAAIPSNCCAIGRAHQLGDMCRVGEPPVALRLASWQEQALARLDANSLKIVEFGNL